MKKKVIMIFTGGTIAMKVDPDLDAAIPGVGSNEIMNMVKDVERFTDIETIDFGNFPSPHMNPNIMWDLSKVVRENIEREDVTGIVITHGTDTLEETAYFLDLTINSEKPIIVVGSMRNNSELGYDGAANISSAIYTAICPEAKNRGVLVVMNNEIHDARDVTKTNTSSVDTFKSLEYGPLGIVNGNRVFFHRNSIERQFLNGDKIENKVALIKAAAGMESDIIDFYIESGYRGIVIEGLGCGNLPPAMVQGVKRAISKGIPLVLVSRCPTGPVTATYGYEGGGSHLRDIGVIFGGIQSGQKARIKLLIILGITKDMEEVRKIFEDYLA